jgi:hypothetical protein
MAVIPAVSKSETTVDCVLLVVRSSFRIVASTPNSGRMFGAPDVTMVTATEIASTKAVKDINTSQKGAVQVRNRQVLVGVDDLISQGAFPRGGAGARTRAAIIVLHTGLSTLRLTPHAMSMDDTKSP